ncbi:MAG: helical backbone metal receptor [Acidobacteria bacterium]|nr:helical backbone metal receptor [Acidobacteriota bacterium]
MALTRHLGLSLALLLASVASAQAPPHRVVSFAPSLTETVVALGYGDRLVGVGDYASWPPAAARLPRVGGLYNPNLERLLALRPDLVLVPSPMPRVEAACASRGIRLETVRTETVEDVEAAARRIAGLLGEPAAGRLLATRLHRQLESVRARVKGRNRPRVLLVLDRPASGRLQEVVTAGPRTFLDQLLRLAGGRNLFHDAPRRYFTPSLETVVERRPQLILELRPGAGDAGSLERQARKEWGKVFGGVEAPRVRVLTEPYLVVPGPRLGRAAELLEAVLHPQQGTR